MPSVQRSAHTSLLEASALAACLLAVPFVIRVELERGADSLRAVDLPLVEGVLWITAAVLLVRFVFRPLRWREVRTELPWSLWAFVVLVGVSLISNPRTFGDMAQFLQCFDYYVLWYCVLLFVRLRSSSKSLERIVVLCSLPLVLAGLYQVFAGRPFSMVNGFFRDRQSYLCSCLMLAPLVWGPLATSSKSGGRALGYVFVFLLSMTLDSVLVAALLIGEMCLWSRLAHGRWRRSSLLVPLLVLLGMSVAGAWRGDAWRSKVPSPFVKMNERRAAVIQAKQAHEPPLPEFDVGVGAWRMFVGTNVSSWLDPAATIEFEEVTDDPVVLQEYFSESWAGLRAIAAAPLFGYGPDQWQARIGPQYGMLERTGTTPPNSSNGYLLLGVSTGVLGLFGWLVSLRRSLALTLRRARGATRIGDRAIGSAAFVGLAGASSFMLICPFVLQPLAMYWVLLLVLGRRGVAMEPRHAD